MTGAPIDVSAVCTRLVGRASPPQNSRLIFRNPFGGAAVITGSKRDGTNCATVIPRCAINDASFSGSRAVSVGAMQSAAPLTSGSQISHCAASKLIAVRPRTMSLSVDG